MEHPNSLETDDGLVPVPHEEQDVNGGIVLILTRVLMVVGGIIPFIPQYVQIMNAQDASGFSTSLCLVVISSSALRIAYWFGHAFDLTLLIQSIIMIGVMLILMELCVRVENERKRNSGAKIQESNFFDFDPNKFWKWTDIHSYIEASLGMVVICTSFALAFRDKEYLIEPIGYLALMIEAALGFPQLVANYQRKSTEGMSIYMVIFWTIGDSVKGFFFFRTSQPIPFRMCAVIQLAADFGLFLQAAIYK